MATSKTQPPSVTRLVTVLKWARYSDTKLRTLQAKDKAADKALEKFKETNKEYKRLKAACERAGADTWQYERKMQEEFRVQRQELINAVMIKGPAPEIIKKISAFCARFNGGAAQ